jgi:hypothetical protein
MAMPEEQNKESNKFVGLEQDSEERDELSDEELEGVAGGKPKGSPKTTA